MREFYYTVKDPVGIHARPAGMLARQAKAFSSETVIHRGDRSANAARLMSVMGLCIKCGDRIRVTVTGEDEDEAAAALERFFEQTL